MMTKEEMLKKMEKNNSIYLYNRYVELEKSIISQVNRYKYAISINEKEKAKKIIKVIEELKKNQNKYYYMIVN